MNSEFFEAVKLLEKEKGVPAEELYEKISTAIVVSVRKDYNGKDMVFCDIDPQEQEMRVYLKKNVVEEIEDEDEDILLADARKYKDTAVIGDVIEIDLETKQFGRIAAQTAKHVIRQGIREAERGKIMTEMQNRLQEVVTAKVQRTDARSGSLVVELGKYEVFMPKNEQIPGEEFADGELIKIFVADVKEGEKGPQIMVSRTHPGLVKRLFETEVPEIYDGTVEIKSIAREAGSRTKIAVDSRDENVDAVGTCIGPRGARVGNVVETLGGEKIDIVRYSEDPAEFIAAALAPADVVGVEIDQELENTCHVTVPDTQLSLAIGNKGQNARLAAKLTGWKIDIRPESGFYKPLSE